MSNIKSAVIYDSYFGNTKVIAEFINSELEKYGSSIIKHSSSADVTILNDIDVLVIGSPTRKFIAAKGINDFIAKIPAKKIKNIKVLSFDTRIDEIKANSKMFSFFVKRFGYAADSIIKRMRKRGAKSVLGAQGFFVTDTEGPLRDGEQERAQSWVKSLLGEGK